MILHGFALASNHICKGLVSHVDMLNCKPVPTSILEGKHSCTMGHILPNLLIFACLLVLYNTWLLHILISILLSAMSIHERPHYLDILQEINCFMLTIGNKKKIVEHLVSGCPAQFVSEYAKMTHTCVGGMK